MHVQKSVTYSLFFNKSLLLWTDKLAKIWTNLYLSSSSNLNSILGQLIYMYIILKAHLSAIKKGLNLRHRLRKVWVIKKFVRKVEKKNSFCQIKQVQIVRNFCPIWLKTMCQSLHKIIYFHNAITYFIFFD